MSANITGKLEKAGRTLLCLTLAFLFHPGLMCGSPGNTAFAATPEILTPRPGSTVFSRNPQTHLVLRQNGGSVPAWLESAGTRIEPLVSLESEGDRFLHFRLPLVPERNRFIIYPGGEPFDLDYRPLRNSPDPNSLGREIYLFHSAKQLPQTCAACHDLQADSALEPLGLRSQDACFTCHPNLVEDAASVHSATANRQCLTCHRPDGIGYPANIEEACVACHTGQRGWRDRDHIHGPMIAGGCTLCHNPHGEANRYQLWADGAVDLCITCHADKENLVDEENPVRFVHGILNGPGCVACHDPHASDHRFVLYQPINELCVGCHPRFKDLKRGHPVGGHPVAGPDERRRPGRELSCTSCHDPHGSPYRFMLFEDSVGGYVCSKCHR